MELISGLGGNVRLLLSERHDLAASVGELERASLRRSLAELPDLSALREPGTPANPTNPTNPPVR